MIIVRLSGGMGNQMFQYAFGRNLAIKNNVPLGLDTAMLQDRTPHPAFQKFVFRNYDLEIFNIQAEVVPQTKIPFVHRNFFSGKINLYFKYFCMKFIPFKGKEKHFQFDKAALNFGPDTYIAGDWQSPKYFEGIEDVIRKDFTLEDPLSEKSKELLNNISSCTSVAINVRRADFVTSSFHGTFGSEYYDNAIAYLSTQISIDKIFVFSDDMKWCEENLKFEFQTVFVGHEYAGRKFSEYLSLMSSCKHFVIPNSSFGWWAAWLSGSKDKIVIAPKRWFADEKINTTDLIPNEWIRL